MYWELASISKIKNEHGIIAHFVAVKEDISEREHAEEVLRKTTDYFAWMWRLPDENPNPVARVSLDTYIFPIPNGSAFTGLPDTTSPRTEPG